MFVTRANRDNCISAGLELCIVAILAILLLVPSPEFDPLLPADLKYGFGSLLAIGLILLLVGRLARVDEPPG
jgi:hypothetical protein